MVMIFEAKNGQARVKYILSKNKDKENDNIYQSSQIEINKSIISNLTKRKLSVNDNIE